MYRRILVALDGSGPSDLAGQAAMALAGATDQAVLIGCHVYAAEMHRARFEEMEPGLPEPYQAEERLDYLRRTHDSLITDGLQLISDAYLAPLARLTQEKEVVFQGLSPEGRNYVELLRAIEGLEIDLVVLGAWGHGRVAESSLGSVTERVLLGTRGVDVLVVRRPWGFKGAPILVGVDGSQNSYAAVQRAAQIAEGFAADLHALAVYDPHFHLGVFGTIAGALPDQDRQRFDFPAQERLHDEIIDRGLEKLYAAGLERGVQLAGQMGTAAQSAVLAGKVYAQIHHYASLHNAGLIVVGRWGLHREAESALGSNTANLARLASGNLLVVAPPKHPLPVPELVEEAEAPSALPWTEGAEARLKRIPFFARRMARRAIEERAREEGVAQITADFVQSMASRMGMGGKGS
jgi:nucleotide-binding universal stress UspA family protein